MERLNILQMVLKAMEAANLSRLDQQKLEISPEAPVFGAPSPLDSLGLVALLIDLEEAFAMEGHDIVLSDERAVSQRRSPFRDVPSLVQYIDQLVNGAAS